jgi:hypothetical protein
MHWKEVLINGDLNATILATQIMVVE